MNLGMGQNIQSITVSLSNLTVLPDRGIFRIKVLLISDFVFSLSRMPGPSS